MQLYETCLVRHGIMVVGPAGSGKSAAIDCLAATLSNLGSKTAVWRMNPKAITAPQMFGRMDAATGRAAAAAASQPSWQAAPAYAATAGPRASALKASDPHPQRDCLARGSAPGAPLLAAPLRFPCSVGRFGRPAAAPCLAPPMQATGPTASSRCSGAEQPRPSTPTPGSCWTDLWTPSGSRTSTR